MHLPRCICWLFGSNQRIVLSHVSIIAGFSRYELRSRRRSTFFNDVVCQPFFGFAGYKLFVLVSKNTRLEGDGLANLWQAWEKWCMANISSRKCARHFALTCNNEVPKLASILYITRLCSCWKPWPNSKSQQKPGIMPRAASVYKRLPMVM